MGVVLDNHLTTSAQVSSVCRSAFYQLRQLRPVVRSLTTDAAKMVIQAFVSLRLDYCNSLFYGISDSLIRRLQAVQNAAARLVTGKRRRDHISQILLQLQWLPVYQHIIFKLAFFVYKSNYGLAPQYLVENCELVAAADRRQLRSSDIATFVIPRIYTRLGDRTFPVAGPQLWNSFPSNLRQSDLTRQQFRRALKTYLFETPAPSDFLFVVCYTQYSYLLIYLPLPIQFPMMKCCRSSIVFILGFCPQDLYHRGKKK